MKDVDDNLIAKHTIPTGKGQTVINNNHARDTSVSINDKCDYVKSLFTDQNAIGPFLVHIRERYPRYMRDQLAVIMTCVSKYGQKRADEVLTVCVQNKLYSATDFKEIISSYPVPKLDDEVHIKPLGDASSRLMGNVEPGLLSMCTRTSSRGTDMEEQNDKIVCIKSYAKRLKLSWLCANAAEMLLEAGSKAPSYDDFICNLLVHEVQGREERQRLKRLKEARLPMSHDLSQYDHSMSNGLTKTQLNQPRELHLIEEGFYLMLSGPSGAGKTYIASGLCSDAIDKGYKAYFRTMDEILTTLKLKDITPSAKREYKCLCESDVIVIDDLMNIIVGHDEDSQLFSFINSTFESTSFIITTNYPKRV